MGNPFEDLRQAVVVRPMNSPGPQGAAGPEVKIQYSPDGVSWHNNPIEIDRYIRFSTDNGVTWSDAIYFNNLAETLEWVEKARQWAENPENVPVIAPDQYSALHHATRAARSEFNAEAAALEAENLVSGAYGVAPPLWNSTTVYNYNDIVSFDNGQVYRCIGTNIVGADHAPNINGIDNEEDWVRVTAVLDGFFEIDENGDFMPMIAPVKSDIFMLDENGDIMYQDPIDIEASMATIELFTLDENGDIAYRDPTDHRPGGGNIELYKEMEFVDSIADFRVSSFQGTTKYVYVLGYYGAGTPGGGMFYRDPESLEADNSGTVIVDRDGIRWKRANVHEEYYASWFGVSTSISDNSPLVQNALNSIPSGVTLVFGTGLYSFKQTVIMPANKTIHLQGSTNYHHNTRLHYSGPSYEVPTAFFDFRKLRGSGEYRGAIRGLFFFTYASNIVCLWLGNCVEAVFENLRIGNFKYGIQIDGYYYHSKFYNVVISGGEYGFRGLSLAHGAVFWGCHFISCGVGFAHGSMIYVNNSYFQNNQVAIESHAGRIVCIDKCYFEGNQEGIHVVDTSEIYPIVVLSNSFLYLPSIPIKQNLDSRQILTLVLSNNKYYNRITIDYFVTVEGGDIIIKAENNIFSSPDNTCHVCSKTPLEASYFNNNGFIVD